MTALVIKKHIQYNRKQRRYEVKDDTGNLTEAFPSGCKPDAIKFAIGLIYPQMANIAQLLINKYPQLDSRIWSACHVIMDGKIIFMNNGDHVADVFGSKQNSIYAVTLLDGDLVCTCPDYCEGGAFTPDLKAWCKHTIAIKIYQTLHKN